jgi:lactate permease
VCHDPPIHAFHPPHNIVLLLLVTRVPQFGLKSLLQRTTPKLSAGLGSLGVLSVSAALVLKLDDIAQNEGISWTYQTLYVPALLPFIVVSTSVLCACAVVPKLSPPGSMNDTSDRGELR